ncbi:MAG: hypothetical protein P8X50_10980 [Maritimibacter sp.]
MIIVRFAPCPDHAVVEILRDAQMAASVKLRCGVVIQHQGRLWAGSAVASRSATLLCKGHYLRISDIYT